jgi:hypothetical protein
MSDCTTRPVGNATDDNRGSNAPPRVTCHVSVCHQDMQLLYDEFDRNAAEILRLLETRSFRPFIVPVTVTYGEAAMGALLPPPAGWRLPSPTNAPPSQPPATAGVAAACRNPPSQAPPSAPTRRRSNVSRVSVTRRQQSAANQAQAIQNAPPHGETETVVSENQVGCRYFQLARFADTPGVIHPRREDLHVPDWGSLRADDPVIVYDPRQSIYVPARFKDMASSRTVRVTINGADFLGPKTAVFRRIVDGLSSSSFGPSAHGRPPLLPRPNQEVHVAAKRPRSASASSSDDSVLGVRR